MIDVEALVQPISAEDACGPDLEYDKGYLELDRISRGRPEQRQGDAIIPAEEPDWKQVERRAAELFTRTKDLRIALLMTKALLNTGGFPGFAQGLALLDGLIEKYWEPVHPRLDPDDDNDPAARMNILSELADPDGIVRWVRITPLVNTKGVGKFNLRDIAIATGELPAVDGAPDMSLIGAAFTNAAPDQASATNNAVRDIRSHLNALLNRVNEQVGIGNGPDLSRLRQLMDQADRVLREYGEASGGADSAASTDTAAEGGDAGGAESPRGRSAQGLSGEINTRNDVLKALDKICAYYDRHEPSSPVPILVRRSRRLVTMGFMDIMRDIAPGGIAEIEVLRGRTEEEST